MIDRYDRTIHYFRVSVTDRCNLRCRYCMPEEGIPNVPHDEILRYDEILRIVRIMVNLGVDRVRLTGGEPLVRKDIDSLAREIKQLHGVSFLGLTTNGILLKPMAKSLRDAGVDGLNISLDTLNPARYKELTRCSNLQDALDGLYAALELGFPAIKVNCVLDPNTTTEDWLSVVSLAKELPIDVRLIEWMPMAGEEGQSGTGSDDVLALLSEIYGPLTPLEEKHPGGPARYWKIDGFKGNFGMIHAISHNFCSGCNRLRLTSTGDLKLCLFYDTGIALKPLLRSGTPDSVIAETIKEAVMNKPKQHQGRVMAGENNETSFQITHMMGMSKTGG